MHHGIRDINFFTTYRCNSRCLNCNIWHNDPTPRGQAELNESELVQLFADPLFAGCPSIGLAGGEPTISAFFWKLLELLPPEKQVTITTNALSTEKLKNVLAAAKNPQRFLVQLSLDGIEAVNDRVRGIEGAFAKTTALLDFLQKHAIPRLISFTINRINHHELWACYELAQRHDALFSTRMAYCGGAYDNLSGRSIYALSDEQLQHTHHQIQRIIDRELFKPTHSPAQLVFLNHIVACHGGQWPKIPCLAMVSGAVIDLYGNVFPNCPVMMRSIGSLHDAALSDIWQNERAAKARAQIERFQCGGCWNDCQMVTNIAADRNFMLPEYVKLKQAWIARQPRETKIDFAADLSALLLMGWHDPEGDATFRYRWTEPGFSFCLPAGTRRIALFALFPEEIGHQGQVGLKIEVDGHIIRPSVPVQKGWTTYVFELPYSSTSLAPCFFTIDGHYCPFETGAGQDRRVLGMAIRTIDFYPANPTGTP